MGYDLLRREERRTLKSGAGGYAEPGAGRSDRPPGFFAPHACKPGRLCLTYVVYLFIISLMPIKPRARTVAFRLTPEEFRLLAKLARANKMTISEWCRHRCSGAK